MLISIIGLRATLSPVLNPFRERMLIMENDEKVTDIDTTSLEINVGSESLKRIKCNYAGDVLVVDVSDATFFTRFSGMVERLNKIVDQYNGEKLVYDKKYKGEESTMDSVVEAANLNIKYIRLCIEAINAVFGADIIKKVFRANYELNPDFCPNIDLLSDFIDQILPVMEKMFGERSARLKRRYSASNRGANTKK